MVSELSAQIKVKDSRIKELESIVGNLQTKYPTLDAVVKSKLAMKESEFEEKCEKVRIIVILPNPRNRISNQFRSS